MTKQIERGSGSAMAAGGVVLLGFLVALIAVTGSWVSARHRAEEAADLSALAVAHAVVFGEEDELACHEGLAVARSNGADLVHCDVVRVLDHVAVQVTVSVRWGWAVANLSPRTSATAYAGNAR